MDAHTDSHGRRASGGSDATLPLPAICLTALRRRHAAQQTHRHDAGLAKHDDELGSPPATAPLSNPALSNRSWDTRCATAGARKITVHDSRRSCGTLLADLDVHPWVAMQILHHAQVSLTMEIYTLASSAATRDALKRLGDSLDA